MTLRAAHGQRSRPCARRVHTGARGEMQRMGQQGRRRAWILRLTLQRSSSLASVHGLSA